MFLQCVIFLSHCAESDEVIHNDRQLIAVLPLPTVFRIESVCSSKLNGVYTPVPWKESSKPRESRLIKRMCAAPIYYAFKTDKVFSGPNNHYLAILPSESGIGYDWKLISIGNKEHSYMPCIEYRGTATNMNIFGIPNVIKIVDITLNISDTSLSQKNIKTQTDYNPVYYAQIEQISDELRFAEKSLQDTSNLVKRLEIKVQEKERLRSEAGMTYQRIITMLTVIIIALTIMIIIILICYSIKLNQEKSERLRILLQFTNLMSLLNNKPVQNHNRSNIRHQIEKIDEENEEEMININFNHSLNSFEKTLENGMEVEKVVMEHIVDEMATDHSNESHTTSVLGNHNHDDIHVAHTEYVAVS